MSRVLFALHLVVNSMATLLPALAAAQVPGAPLGTTAFVDVNVLPLDTERVLSHHTVLIEGGRIVALGPSSKIKVPADAVQIDSRGKYLIPGLGDMHVHINYFWPSLAGANAAHESAATDRLFLWLAQGTTTVRNADYLAVGEYEPVRLDQASMLRLRARAAAGEIWSPRIYTSGPWGPPFSGKGARSLSRRTPTTPDSVAAYVAAYKVAGYDYLKIHDEEPAIFDSIAAAARRVGLPFAGHVPVTVPLAGGLASGMRSIEHFSGYLFDRWTGEWPRARGHHAAVPDHPDSLKTWAEATRRAGVWNSSRFGVPSSPRISRLIQALHASGAGLLIGTDEPALPLPSTMPGHGDPTAIHSSLQGLVDAGLTPYQALEVGTRNVAAFFGTLSESGTIAVGKRADLVLLTGNPLQDIKHTAQPAGVMIGGRWLSRTAIDQRVAAMKTATAATP